MDVPHLKSQRQLAELLGEGCEASELLGDAKVYWELRSEKIALGDIYEWIYEIEVELHKYIRSILLLAHGDDEAGWWKHGVPE